MRFRFSQTTIAAADGTAQIIHQVRGHVSCVVTRQTVTCKLRVAVGSPPSTDPPLQSTALIYLNGVQLEGSYSGNNDKSDTRELIEPGGEMIANWSGCTPGTLCTYTVSGPQYPFGQAPPE